MCCDASKSEDVLENESRSSIGGEDEIETEKEVLVRSSTTESSVNKEDGERKSEDKVVIAENDENVEYLKNLTSRYVIYLLDLDV